MQLQWLREHRGPDEVANLQEALRNFGDRIGQFPGIGRETGRQGTISYRVAPIGMPFPYLVYYTYDTADPNGPVTLVLLAHESQDRERFDPGRFE